MADPIQFNFGAASEPTGPPPDKPKETSIFGQAGAGFHEQLGKAVHAAKNITGIADSAVNLFQKYTGKSSKDSKSEITQFLDEVEEHQKQASAKAGPPQTGMQGFARSTGAAPVEIGEFLLALPIARRPAAAMALVKAAESMDKGVGATARAAVGGFASGKSMEAFDALPLKPRVAANVLSGGVAGLTGGEGIKGAVTQGLAQGALSAVGLPGKNKEKLSPWERIDMVTQSTTPHWNSIKRVFAPDKMSSEGSKMAGNTSEHFAVQEMELNRASDELESARTYFDKQPKDLNQQFYYGYQQGKVPAGLEDFGNSIKSVTDKMWDDLHERGLTYSYLENYLPGIYKDPNAAKKALAGIAARGTGTGQSGPFRGSRSFKYQKKYSNAEIAKATAGLELLHDNPVDNVMASMMQGRKAIAAHDIMKEATEDGQGMWVRFKKGGYILPKGREEWVTSKKRDDPTFVKYAAPPKKGTPGQGAPGKKEIARWYAHPDVFNIIDNHLAPGLSSIPVVGPAFNGVRAYGNFENGLHFGLSGRHANTTANNSMAEAFGRGWQELFKGNFSGAAKEAGWGASTLGPGIRDYITGKRMKSKLMTDTNPIGSEGPRTVENFFIQGGGRVGRDRIYNTDMAQKFRQLWSQGKVIRGGLVAPLVPLEKMSNVVMKNIVPNVKLGAANRRLELKMKEMGPNASRADMRREARRITNHIDNVFGEIVWDNRFTPKVVRDVSSVIFQAPGWNLGSMNIVSSTVSDLVKKGPKALADSPAASYVLGLITAQAWIGAVTQLSLGQGFPKSFDDFMHPRDGSTDVNGNPGRIHSPNYISNDAYGFFHDPVTTVVNKLNSLITQTYEFGRNKDWQGRTIRKPEHSPLGQVGDVASWYAKQSSPYAVRQILDAQDASGETSAKDIAGPLVGINKSPLWISESPAERLGSDMMAGKGGFNADPEREEAYKKERQLAGKLRQGKDVSEEIGQESEEGNLGKRDIKNIYKSGSRKHIEILVNRATLDEALALYKKGSPEEKDLMKPYIYKKLKGLKTDSQKERDRLLQKFDDVVNEGTQPPPSRDIPFNFSVQ